MVTTPEPERPLHLVVDGPEEAGEPPEPAEPGHPLGKVGVALDDAVDRLWEPLRGNPLADRIFYTASELGDFSLIWHIAGSARGLSLLAPGRRVVETSILPISPKLTTLRFSARRRRPRRS